MSGTVTQIEKLNEDNYASWGLQMRSVLITLDYWHVVQNTCESTDAGELAKWQKLEQKALAIIMLNVNTKLLIHIKCCVSAKEAWEKLKEIYQAKGPARKVFLFKQLIRFKFTSESKYSQQLNEFCEIVDTIGATDLKVPDDLLSVLLLSSLPDSFENFVVAIESRDKLPTFEQLKIKIIEEDQRRGEINQSDDSAQKVFAAKTSKNYGGENKRSVECGKQRFSSFYENKPKRCYACGKLGHIRSQCKNKNHTVMLTFCNKNFEKNSWVLDSGASSHMCSQQDYFCSITPISQRVILASGEQVNASGIGTIKVKTSLKQDVWLYNVLFVPDLKMNFLAVSKIIKAGCSVNFYNTNAVVKNKEGNTILIASLKDDIFTTVFETNDEKIGVAIEKHNEVELWHKRLGHLNYRDLNLMCTKGIVRGLKIKPQYDINCCENCALCKIHRLPFEHFDSVRSLEKLQIVHTDICGPIRVRSEGGSSYFILFIDDFSRYASVYFLKHKSDALNKFKLYKSFVENQTGCKIKCLRSDNGREFINHDFDIFLQENGIQRQTTTPYTPQQNGTAERANRTIMEMARCMLNENNVSKFLWSEAVNTAVYIRNRCPSKILKNISPYEIWFNKTPCIAHLRVFGSSVVTFNKKPHKCKLEPKGEKAIFVGYSESAKAYRLYSSEKKTIIISRDVKFLSELSSINTLTEIIEESFFFIKPNSESDVGDCESGKSHTKPDIVENSVNKRKMSGRPRMLRTGNRGRPKKLKNYSSKSNVLNHVSLKSDPITVNEALKSESSKHWKLAMKKEYDSLMKNETWELVNADSAKNVVGCKWVFATKYDPEGNVEKYKARLVAQGCQQKYNINYSETFAPVACHPTIRLFLALVAKEGLYLNHVDIVAAYLNGDLLEDVFMTQPQMFIDENQPNMVCKLKKSIYGLKQAGRDWNLKLNSTLLHMGFVRCKTDNCLYIKMYNGNERIFLLVYVDDILLACKDNNEIKKVIAKLNEHFDVVDRGPAKYFIGMEIERNESTVVIHQNKFTMDLLAQYNMKECKPANTPWASCMILIKCENSSCDDLRVKEYQSLIGSLMHLAIVSRPDIMHTITKLSRFNTHPHQEHFNAAKHVLRYLKKYPKGRIVYDNPNQNLVSYADADWGSDDLDRKSYSGYAIFFGGGPIVWASKKQDVVSLSSTEAEYISLSQAAKDVIFIQSLICELALGDNVKKPVIVYCDNQGAKFLATNPVIHKRSKHIDIRYHFIKEKCDSNEIQITYIPTNENIADILTKCLTNDKHGKFTNMLLNLN